MSSALFPRELAELLLAQAFSKPRDARSGEYKEGIKVLLYARLTKTAMPRPYKAGTASYDAFYAGVDEGQAIWREYEKTGRVR
jgi:hypothetical protein